MIVDIEAKFACDDCGTEFIVKLDPAYDPPSGWTLFDVAENAIRAGDSYEDADDTKDGWAIGSVDDDRHYCCRCTKKNDAT